MDVGDVSGIMRLSLAISLLLATPALAGTHHGTSPRRSATCPRGPLTVEHDFRLQQGGSLADGRPDAVDTFTYRGGLLMRWERRPLHRGYDHILSTYRRDGRGRLVEQHTVTRSRVRTLRARYLFGQRGRLRFVETDSGADGSVDYRDEELLDGRGRKIRVREMIKVSTGRAGLNRRFVYDRRGRLGHEDVDNDGDGRFNLRIHYRYDPSGRLARKTRDWGMDGTPEQITTYRYRADGKLDHTVERSGLARSGWVTRYAYDGRGNRVLEERLLQGGNVVTRRRRLRYHPCTSDGAPRRVGR
jgi:YD repeat-containing protein